MSYTLLEQETNINYNREEEHAIIYTASPVDKRKIEKLIGEYPDQIKVTRNTSDDITVEVPKEWIKIKPTKKMSEEQRQKCAERARINFGLNSSTNIEE